MDKKKWDVYVYGDINIDLVIPGVEKLPIPGQEDVVDTMATYIGGGAALFTLGIGKLGLNPVFQGTIGNDLYGKFIRDELRQTHVDDELIDTSAVHGTGISISFTTEKDRCFLTYRGTNSQIDVSKIDSTQVAKARHIHLTSYMGRKNHETYLKLLQQLKQNCKVTVSFDVGWDDTEEWYEGIYELLPYIDVLFMNETEALHYTRKGDVEEAIEELSKACPLVVIKVGKEGAIAKFGDIIYRAPGYNVTAIDTTGAGDSFNAGFIYGFLLGKNVAESLKYGNGCGALSVTALGGNTGFPDVNTLENFIKEQEVQRCK